ncbi:MAG: hypothetical protein AB7P48_11625, partial [Methylocystis sp.]
MRDPLAHLARANDADLANLKAHFVTTVSQASADDLSGAPRCMRAAVQYNLRSFPKKTKKSLLRSAKAKLRRP